MLAVLYCCNCITVLGVTQQSVLTVCQMQFEASVVSWLTVPATASVQKHPNNGNIHLGSRRATAARNWSAAVVQAYARIYYRQLQLQVCTQEASCCSVSCPLHQITSCACSNAPSAVGAVHLPLQPAAHAPTAWTAPLQQSARLPVMPTTVLRTPAAMLPTTPPHNTAVPAGVPRAPIHHCRLQHPLH
jgi:hypothetical protein